MFREDEYDYEHDDLDGEEEVPASYGPPPRSLLDQCVDTGLISPDALPHGYRTYGQREQEAARERVHPHQNYEPRARFYEPKNRPKGPFDRGSARSGYGTDYRSADGTRRHYGDERAEAHAHTTHGHGDEQMDPEMEMGMAPDSDDSPLISAKAALWFGSMLAVYFFAKSRFQKQQPQPQQPSQPPQRPQGQQPQPDLSGWVPGVIKW